MSDRFVADKLAWLDAVASDRRVGLLGFRVAFAIASHVNRKMLQAWPTYETLANEVGVKPRSVMRAIEELEGAGHLSISRTRGHHPNRYRWILGAEPELPLGEETVTEESPLGPQETVSPESPLDDANGDTGVTEQQPQTVTLQATNSDSTVNKQCHQSHPEHFEEHSEEHIEGHNGQKRGGRTRKRRTSLPSTFHIAEQQFADAERIAGWDTSQEPRESSSASATTTVRREAFLRTGPQHFESGATTA
jgi:Helix-turn-helix domain